MENNMDVYCYADDISLRSPTFTGLKEMLKICGNFAGDHDSREICLACLRMCRKFSISLYV